MRRLLPTLATIALLAVPGASVAPAQAQTGVSPARGFVPHELVVKLEGQRFGRTIDLPARAGVLSAARALRDNPRVAYAAPNYIATASAASPLNFLPDDPGTLGNSAEAASAGNWSFKQWNFLPWEESSAGPRLPFSPGGIDAVSAWRNLILAGHPGANGVIVAVLDTGIAYRREGDRFRRSPDFAPRQFVPGADFVDGDRRPFDENGHGTHVAGTIAERTDNEVGLTGLAYGAKLMPVRVLDRYGRGTADAIAKGIRLAVAGGADVINMSFNFGCGKRVPGVDEALREAYKQGVVTVASVGNLGSETCVSAPATGPRVIGVGGSTEGGCLGSYSLAGEGVDLVAPGGGVSKPGCASISARPIYQVTLRAGHTRVFSIPGNYVGTSMSAAHVSGVAAMVLASGVLGSPPKSPARVIATTRRLLTSARDLGLPATQQGAGLLDAGAATDPGN